MLLIIAISTFVCISLGMLGVYWLLYKPQSASTERLRRLAGREGGGTQSVGASAVIPDDSPASDIAQKIAQPLNKLLPPSATEARKLQRQLMHAGFRSPEAPIIYRAIQLSSMAGFPLIVAGVCALLGKPIGNAMVYIILAFVAGFFLPRYFLSRMTKNRQRELRWGLADALDLMVVSVEAGLGLNAAMLKVASELRDVHSAIAIEFELANLEIRVGRDRDEALRNLAERTGVEDLRSLVAMLIQTDKFGTSIAKGLRVFSDGLRTKRRQRAEQEAQKAAVKLLFPLACFLFPTLFIAILGPAALNLMDVLAKMD
ncbi:MAG TPA: type II secretion system F family protein [Pyrinomonadaceae bacterium]|jgi:tight adherence protein C|nr:type II secretion system F family protein [Pyrinomonadaceae bacterium]